MHPYMFLDRSNFEDVIEQRMIFILSRYQRLTFESLLALLLEEPSFLEVVRTRFQKTESDIRQIAWGRLLALCNSNPVMVLRDRQPVLLHSTHEAEFFFLNITRAKTTE